MIKIMTILLLILLTSCTSEFVIRDDLSVFSNEAFMECVNCVDGETWGDRACCNDNFYIECEENNGVIKSSDLHPVFSGSLKGCFQKAPDVGKECSANSECLSGVCNLEQAVKTDKCTLINKEFRGEKNPYGNEEFYTANYSCTIEKPGICTETRNNRGNPGGVNHYFKMEGLTLIEVLEEGNIY